MPTVALALRVAASAEFRSASWQVTRKQETDRNGGPVGLKFLLSRPTGRDLYTLHRYSGKSLRCLKFGDRS